MFPVLVVLFCVSGIASLIYQVVWLRLAMAGFGVNTGLVSIVLSVFMAGLALGSWAGGRWAERLGRGGTAPPLRAYALTELLVATSVWVVPAALAGSARALNDVAASWGSALHFAGAGGAIALVLGPFCVAMGATIPLAMGALRRDPGSRRSFSALYAANVIGAALGTLGSAFVLIEVLGFRATLVVAASCNLLVGLAAVLLTVRSRRVSIAEVPLPAAAPPVAADRERRLLVALFATGVVSMAVEVVWVRLYTPYLGNVVYAFASLLAVYLIATFAGSLAYRRWSGHGTTAAALWLAAPLSATLALVAADPRIGAATAAPEAFGLPAPGPLLRVVLGVAPFSAAVGFLTPMLVDRWSQGVPRRAGSAYGVNVLGCIAGPLVAGFVLLPRVGERSAIALLALALLAAAAPLVPRRRVTVGVVGLLVVVATLGTRSFESDIPGAIVRRDATATVAARPAPRERLVVNGIGMTHLTPVTKMMAHLPLALHRGPLDHGVLVICLGMGTSLRSALSWGLPATAVELVPSVAELAPLFHPDAPGLFEDPRARVVVDDGRRFLERTAEVFDVVVIDPPPPTRAAGSSLLYSLEFYAAVRARLAPGGVVQQWVPGGDAYTRLTLLRAVTESFRHVRTFGSVEGWGLHIVASDRSLEFESVEELTARLPPAAARDLVAWGPAAKPLEQLRLQLERELPLPSQALARVPALRDDKPVNEYDFLRRQLGDRRREQERPRAKPTPSAGLR